MADRSEVESRENSTYQPTLRDMLMLEAPFGVKVAPAASLTLGDEHGPGCVAALVRTTHWKDNRYEDVCHVYGPTGGGRCGT